MNAPVSFGIKLRIRVMTGLVRLRPEKGRPYIDVLRPGSGPDVHEAILDPNDKWMRIPKFQNLGLEAREWETHWDELHIEVEHQVGAHWELFDEDSWTPYLPKEHKK